MIAKGFTVREAAMRLKVGKTALYEALRTPDVERDKVTQVIVHGLFLQAGRSDHFRVVTPCCWTERLPGDLKCYNVLYNTTKYCGTSALKSQRAQLINCAIPPARANGLLAQATL
jgi:hypothetical protein